VGMTILMSLDGGEEKSRPIGVFSGWSRCIDAVGLVTGREYGL